MLDQHQAELLLGELLIHLIERKDVECEIPGGIPGIFPFVRHGEDVGVVHVVAIRRCASRTCAPA